MSKVLEARYYSRDPCLVAAENELMDRAAEERRKKRAPIDQRHNRRRIRALTAKAKEGIR